VSISECGPFNNRTEFKLGRRNVVFGPNDSGKSTLCEVIGAFSGGENYRRFAERFQFCRGSTRRPVLEVGVAENDTLTTVRLSQQALELGRSGSTPSQRLHIQINENVAASWPRSLFNVIVFRSDVFKSRGGPKDPLAHGIRYLAQQLDLDEQSIWDMLRDEMFLASPLGYRIRRVGLRQVEVLVPDGRDFYLPAGNLSSSELIFCLLEILLKILRCDPRTPPWFLIFDTQFSYLDSDGKQKLFDLMTAFDAQTIFCVNFEEAASDLKDVNYESWTGASVGGGMTIHTFL
jgi:energy-coupling factor transporter ATP-binding protein EcfA2